MAKTGISGVCGALTLKAKNGTVFHFVNMQRRKSCFYGWTSYIMKNEFDLKFMFDFFRRNEEKTPFSAFCGR
jgi:hypothetical protein